MSRRLSQLLLLACGLALLPLAAPAQDFPSKPLKIIVPNPPGGSGDMAARLVAQKWGERFRQTVVVENQAGASGTIGMNMVKRAAPDGSTIGVTISLAQIVDRIQNKTASFDLARDFTPLTAIANNPVVLLVNAQVTAASLTEFIAAARQRPGEMSYSSPGIGTAHHLYGEVLNRVAGIKMVNVPYKGVAPALNDLLGGHVPVGIISLSAALPHVLSGRLRALAMFDARRHPKLPDVPLVSEVLPNFELARSWIGFLGPPELPPTITARLNEELVRILQSDDAQRVFDENGLEVVANTSSEFAAMIRRDIRLWEEAATAAGLFAR
ncbi:MAG: hypothetical protein QOI12_3474 [Alphaproteobacteria bacterium]|nr:hypothetical protein [Alphaproteobacteria bacterium]